MLLNYYDTEGSGQPLLFIHGTASSSVVWEEQCLLFSEYGFRAIRVDLRGHGKSGNPGGSCTIDDHLEDIIHTLKYLKIKRKITIIGHSFGAVLAIKFAERYSNMVKKLLLVSMPARVPRLVCLYYKWLLGKPALVIKRRLQWLTKMPILKRYKCAIISDLRIVRQIWRDSLYWDFLKDMPAIKCPSYFCVGRFDNIALSSLVEKLHKNIPNSKFKEMKWAAHSCMDDQPREFNSWIMNVLNVKLLHLT